ncbi:MAG: FAD-dependent oxidoreductase [Thermoguttaceae bacterium]|nr:FAD-dependent oxidoreductase [Thermoguttaceae bacterium]
MRISTRLFTRCKASFWTFFVTVLLNAFFASVYAADSVFVEAESFQDKGGWVVDQQFMDIKAPGQAGSVILLAHGMGKPVANAKTTVTLPNPGKYQVFARTRNWVSNWMPADLSDEARERDWAPGKFRLVLNGKPSEITLGIHGSGWSWQKAGSVTATENNLQVAVELQDLTGFDGRVDALYFTTDPAEKCALPDDPQSLDAVRPVVREENPKVYDLVVVGGGIAGTCAACSAAKLGLNVALIQDRPVLGGNGSTEVRVHLKGELNQPPYQNVGNLAYQMGPKGGGCAREAEHYKDDQRLAICQKYANLDLFLLTHVTAVEKEGDSILAVIGKNVESGVETRFKGKLFADCTGDGCIGFLAGADWLMGREAKSDFDEPSAPEKRDKMTMGASCQWYTVETDHATTFPELPWAHQFSKESIKPMIRGSWFWETGLNYDQIWEFERIRDNALRSVYGHWSYMKNHANGKWSETVKNREIGWLAFICGKRESRRILGDVVLREQDIMSDRQWEDACVPCTWPIDLHYPDPQNAKHFPGNEFLTYCRKGPKPPHYAIPYRTLYSRNVKNLFMAGRDISVTHIALGTTRVMRTGGMMGEVVGMAASVCRKNDCSPRDVYTDHLPELIELMKVGVADSPEEQPIIQTPKWLPTAGVNYALTAKVKASAEYGRGMYPATRINDGNADLTNNESRWVGGSDTEDTWVEFTWKEPVTINACRIVTGRFYEGRLVDPVGSFKLQLFQNGRWVDIPKAGIGENAACDIGVQFDDVTTNRLRLFINTPGFLGKVWELELYRLKN